MKLNNGAMAVAWYYDTNRSEGVVLAQYNGEYVVWQCRPAGDGYDCYCGNYVTNLSEGMERFGYRVWRNADGRAARAMTAHGASAVDL